MNGRHSSERECIQWRTLAAAGLMAVLCGGPILIAHAVPTCIKAGPDSDACANSGGDFNPGNCPDIWSENGDCGSTTTGRYGQLDSRDYTAVCKFQRYQPADGGGCEPVGGTVTYTAQCEAPTGGGCPTSIPGGPTNP